MGITSIIATVYFYKWLKKSGNTKDVSDATKKLWISQFKTRSKPSRNNNEEEAEIQLLNQLNQSLVKLGNEIADGTMNTWHKYITRTYKVLRRKQHKLLTPDQHVVVRAYIQEVSKIYALQNFITDAELIEVRKRWRNEFPKYRFSDLTQCMHYYTEEFSNRSSDLENLGVIILPLPNDAGDEPTRENIATFVTTDLHVLKDIIPPIDEYIRCYNEYERCRAILSELQQFIQNYVPRDEQNIIEEKAKEEFKEKIIVPQYETEVVAPRVNEPEEEHPPEELINIFSKCGEGWEITFDLKRIIIGDSVGMGYLAQLLAKPDVSIS